MACLLAPYVFLPLSLPWRAVLLALLFVLGGLAATRAERLLGRKDPGEVVIDELVGVWLVLLPFKAPGFGLVLAAFAFFRLFDIRKPCFAKAPAHGGRAAPERKAHKAQRQAEQRRARKRMGYATVQQQKLQGRVRQGHIHIGRGGRQGREGQGPTAGGAARHDKHGNRAAGGMGYGIHEFIA